MTTYVGGLRARLVRESLYRMLHDSLDALGWFDAGRAHLPVTFEASSVSDADAIAKNTAALADWDATELQEEMGSQFSQHRMTYYVDFFAENDAIGLHFGQDVKDILGGRMRAIGRSEPNIVVYDWTQATPGQIFTVEIENIVVDRPVNVTKSWQRFMRSVRFDVVDYYANDQEV